MQSRGLPRAFVRYDDLLADWAATMGRVGRLLDEPGLHDLDDSRRSKVDAFVSPELRRQIRGWEDLAVPVPLRGLADRTWEALLPLAADGREAPALDALRTEYEELHADSEAIAQSSIRAAGAGRKPAKPPKPASAATPKGKAAPPPGFAVRVKRRLRRALRGRRTH
jgi:hypothetical protein